MLRLLLLLWLTHHKRLQKKRKKMKKNNFLFPNDPRMFILLITLLVMFKEVSKKTSDTRDFELYVFYLYKMYIGSTLYTRNLLNDIQYLISKPKDKHVIVTFWLYKNKKNKNGMISRNNSHLVAQGYTQKEGIDFEEMVALIIRLESVRLLI